MRASDEGNTKIVKIFIEHKRTDINFKNVLLFLSKFISIIWYFKIIFGISSNYYIQHLCGHLRKAAQKQSNCFLNKKELILIPKIFHCFYQYLFQLFYILKSYLEIIQIIMDSTYESIWKRSHRNRQNTCWTRRNWYQC